MIQEHKTEISSKTEFISMLIKNQINKSNQTDTRKNESKQQNESIKHKMNPNNKIKQKIAGILKNKIRERLKQNLERKN